MIVEYALCSANFQPVLGSFLQCPLFFGANAVQYTVHLSQVSCDNLQYTVLFKFAEILVGPVQPGRARAPMRNVVFGETNWQ